MGYRPTRAVPESPADFSFSGFRIPKRSEMRSRDGLPRTDRSPAFLRLSRYLLQTCIRMLGDPAEHSSPPEDGKPELR
jgi:hypothetical protein